MTHQAPAAGEQAFRDRIMQALQEKPQTSEELAALFHTSDRTIRRRLEVLPVTSKKDNRRIIYSLSTTIAVTPLPDDGKQTQIIPVVSDQEVPANSEKGDIEGDVKEEPKKTDGVTVCDKSVTGKKGHSVTVTLTMYIDYFRANQERRITTLDLAQHFHVNQDAVRQSMSRLQRTGPVSRIAPGLFQYDPTKEQGNLHSVLRSGNRKFENVVLVTKGTRYSTLSRSEPSTEPEKNPACDILDSPIPAPGPRCVPHPEWPGMDLPTGQQVRWWNYPNGTEMICISANGAPPIDPGYLMFIIESTLRDHGFDPAKWDVSCVEYLIDSEKIRYDGAHQYQAFEKEVFKGYNHGYYGRFERADRRITPAAEFMDECRILVEGTLNTQAIREVRALKKEVEEIGKTARTAYSIADTERDIRIEAKRSTKKAKPPVSLFTTGTAIMQEQAPATAPGAK